MVRKCSGCRPKDPGRYGIADMKLGAITYLSFAMAILLSVSCNETYAPKPRGFFRIDLPEKSYQRYNGPCPFSFEYPSYAVISPDSSANRQRCWQNISLPQFNATIHLSYHPIQSEKTLNELSEDSRTFAFKHTSKATSIDEARIHDPEKRKFGVYYTIEGNTASFAQFYLTDSTRHYLRAALYFNEEPRADSIKPVLSFIKKDIDVLIKSFNWK